MLKDFWEKNKHQIQLTGILTGVGALFLSIPNPEVEVASVVLQKIQFVWLIIVTVSVALLFYNLYTLLKLYEDKNKEDKEGFHFDETISLIIFATIFYFVMNMWIYTYSLYKEAFFSFIVIAYYGILKAGAIVVSLNFQYPASELQGQLIQSETKGIVCADMITGGTQPYETCKQVRDKGKTPLEFIVVASVEVNTSTPLAFWK